MASPKRTARAALAVTVAGLVSGTIVAKRRGYSVGRNALARCRKGHLFTTIWIPGVSVKAVRLGLRRIQRCPVGPHWSLVRLLREADLTEAEFIEARSRRDSKLP